MRQETTAIFSTINQPLKRGMSDSGARGARLFTETADAFAGCTNGRAEGTVLRGDRGADGVPVSMLLALVMLLTGGLADR